MLSHLEMAGYVPSEVGQQLGDMRRWLDDLRDRGSNRSGAKNWTAFGLSRAALVLFRLPGWQAVDGHFMRRMFEHSWLARRDAGQVYVLDLVPVMGMGSILVGMSGASPWSEAYIGDLPRFGPRLSEFQREADEIIALSREIGT